MCRSTNFSCNSYLQIVILAILDFFNYWHTHGNLHSSRCLTYPPLAIVFTFTFIFTLSPPYELLFIWFPLPLYAHFLCPLQTRSKSLTNLVREQFIAKQDAWQHQKLRALLIICSSIREEAWMLAISSPVKILKTKDYMLCQCKY